MTARRLPQVAIVGRPNVGKSTLLNRLIGERRAIVDDIPGVTRDRLYYDVVWNGQKVKVVDTGGFVHNSDDPFGSLINDQVDQALAESDVVVLVVDGPEGIHPLDEAMADRIRRSGKRAVLAINKIDDPNQHPYIHTFYGLGIGDAPIGLSALHGSVGVGDLLDEILARLPEGGAVVEETEEAPVRIALVGRPNVGKSSILNKLLGYQRSIVSDISGTTRDAIDAELAWKGQKFHLVDTAGIRKKSKVDYGVELFAVDRSIRAMREANVTLLVIDAVEGLTDQDKNLINASHEAGNALVIVVNKWDLIPEKSTKSTVEYEKRLLRDAPHAHFAQVMFISALTGQRIHRILEAAQFAAENHRRRVTTHLVNRLISEAIMLTPPPHIKSRQLKILYSTQIKASPPTFVLFVNSGKLLKDTYRRYLEKHLRANIELTGTPIRFIVRERKKDTPG